MIGVTVGVDPHKRSVTIEAIDEQEKKLATGRFGTGRPDYQAMLGYVRQQWPNHRWAIEGGHGVGRPLAQRLLADGETVVDVPAKLAARVRVFDTGNARKTDATDAHAIAAVRYGRRTFGCWNLMRIWWSCGCWSTGATGCRRAGCRPSTGCTGC